MLKNSLLRSRAALNQQPHQQQERENTKNTYEAYEELSHGSPSNNMHHFYHTQIPTGLVLRQYNPV